MEIIQLVNIILQVIGAATVSLNIIAPLTKNTIDNKVLNYLKLLLAKIALNIDESKITIDVKGMNVIRK